MNDTKVVNPRKVAKFSKIRCLTRPERASDMTECDSYAKFELHLGQFLSNIVQDISFLPNAIYKPRIDVLVDGNLAYRTKVLDHLNDAFDERIALRIYSPNSVVTLELYECENLDMTDTKEAGTTRIKNVLKDESMSEFLVSFVEIQVGLLIPDRKYDLICSFRSNPAFYSHNPGGILCYPTRNGIPCILLHKVCCSCKVCTFLSHKSTMELDGYENLHNYFDYRIDTSKDRVLNVMKLRSQTCDVTSDSFCENDVDTDFGEIFFSKDSCRCCKLVDLPKLLTSKTYEICLSCHDYEVCCDHSLNYYYVSVCAKMVGTKKGISFFTELFAMMLDPYLSTDANGLSRLGSFISMAEGLYENYNSLKIIKKHLGYRESGAGSSRPNLVLYIVLPFLCGVLFHKIFFATILFLLSIICVILRRESLIQHELGLGDAVKTSKRLTVSGSGLEKAITEMMEEESDVSKIVPNRFERNNVEASQREIVKEAEIYTKLHKSLKRSENIALKTVVAFLSSSIPRSLGKSLTLLLQTSDKVVWSANSVLAVIRNYGAGISLTLSFLGLLSLRFGRAFYLAFKSIVVMLIISIVFKDTSAMKYVKRLCKSTILYSLLLVQREEWFLNVR